MIEFAQYVQVGEIPLGLATSILALVLAVSLIYVATTVWNIKRQRQARRRYLLKCREKLLCKIAYLKAQEQFLQEQEVVDLRKLIDCMRTIWCKSRQAQFLSYCLVSEFNEDSSLSDQIKKQAEQYLLKSLNTRQDAVFADFDKM